MLFQLQLLPLALRLPTHIIKLDPIHSVIGAPKAHLGLTVHQPSDRPWRCTGEQTQLGSLQFTVEENIKKILKLVLSTNIY